ncbi:MAG: hypothetical protein QXE33_03640 [Candidatus Micrarchaeaceae archaeon]
MSVVVAGLGTVVVTVDVAVVVVNFIGDATRGVPFAYLHAQKMLPFAHVPALPHVVFEGQLTYAQLTHDERLPSDAALAAIGVSERIASKSQSFIVAIFKTY